MLAVLAVSLFFCCLFVCVADRVGKIDDALAHFDQKLADRKVALKICDQIMSIHKNVVHIQKRTQIQHTYISSAHAHVCTHERTHTRTRTFISSKVEGGPSAVGPVVFVVRLEAQNRTISD